MKRKRTTQVILNAAALAIAVFMLFPIAWIILNSFKAETEIFAKPIRLLPREFLTVSYTKYLVENNVFRGFFNSLFIASGSLIVGLAFAVPSAYGLARFRLKSAKAVLMMFLVTQMLPSSLLLTPMYLVFSKIGILNNYIAPILAVATINIPFIVVITRPFFLNLPKGIDDAARIDGCTAFGAFFRVMLPIAKPGVVTSAALAFIFGWNDLAYSMTFNIRPALRPLTAIIYNLMPKEGVKWSGVMALATTAILPIIIIFLILQEHIVGGLTAGSVKE
ncbi:MAG: carbohydrate ABC transporter permease [Treponema sp.]|jgi:multiple sugar transport system permease protein|nr:carbohydrate ABC transporter permease [Treponema sp.]